MIDKERLNECVGGLAAIAMVIEEYERAKPRLQAYPCDREILDDWKEICAEGVRNIISLVDEIAARGAPARILTGDEIRALPHGGVVWVEFFNGEEKRATSIQAAMKCGEGYLVDEETCVYEDYEDDMRPDGQGSRWRFWSAEPSAQQREETPWEKG